MAKVFVGNFSFAVDDKKLNEHFSQIAPVLSAKVMKEGPTGRSRGFGFVEFASPDDAANAITKLDGTVWEGRVIKVSEDRSNRRHDGHGDDRPSYSGGHSHGGGHGGSSHYQGNQGGYQGGHSGGGYQGQGGEDSGFRQSAPTGYFRAQPLEINFRRKKKLDPFVEDPSMKIDYKDVRLLGRFVSERGRILPRRMTGLNALNQRQITRAVKRAQHLALMPIVKE